ncbi:hypothetical protein A4H97_29420 [Niastella yeongjuensis]|uniref:Peptidase S8/S53 domain-containing protein n=1 Tax=Niastella yeongjuensis TaxID=354355 RepID=A0A1V9ET03_9BACT|nr:hypothetical protein A4H97_29420 [Niastella yeongjuensis]
MTAQLQSVKESWELNLQEREESGLPEISDKKTIPIFLHIDLAKDVESLKSFGIEVISEEEEGFILGANSDDLKTFSDRLEQFLNQSNKKFKDSAAGIFDLITEPTERLKRILSANLLAKWERLQEEREIVVYIAISSYLKIPDYPTQGGNQPDDSYNSSVARWKDRNQEWQVAKDELCMERQTAFENFIRPHNGVFVSLVSQYAEFDDGFGCKIRISGVGLKDLALNFPFIFNILEHDPLLSFQGTTELERLLEIEVAAPDENFPKVCVIDSGIQEGHRLLAPAIDGTLSISYVPNDLDTFDKVSNGGHGTRVAGAVLFPIGLPSNGTHVKAPFWIQNARILDDENLLSSSLNESDLMKMIVDRFKPTRIFNLSVSNGRPENYIHMPLWSATIDKLIWENDILFCIAAGNISQHSNNPEIPGVLNYLTDGVVYPAFLKHGKSKITNPGYSCFALTVGSISDSEFEDEVFKCIGSRDLPSAFSRSGLGLWGMIKPDVVEYGGDFVINKPTGDNVIAHTESSPNLIRSTRDNGPAVGRDVVGTSFTTPKVTHIVASLQNLYPHETTLLYRALVVQSARIPSAAEKIEEFISHYGYGIPNIERAISNSTRRVTLYASGLVNPKNSDLYLVKLPNEITRPGYDYDVLIEITLSFKAEPRITRRKTNSYLSAWLDWETSRKGETQKTFSERILAANNETQEDFEEPNLDEENTDNVDDLKPESFKWTIGSKGKDGELKGVKRQDSTVQKDWCIEKSNQLPKEFLIAVKGHKGWEKNLDKEIPYSIVVSFEVLNTEIEVDIYNLVRIENQVEVESQQEIQITT